MERKNERSNAMWGLVAAFILLAILFWMDVWGKVTPITQNEVIDKELASTAPVQSPLEKPILHKIGFEYRCSSCHQHFKPAGRKDNLIAEHLNIKLNHGEDVRCLNCHNEDGFVTFVGHSGESIPYDQSEFLCRKCHGPVYQNWRNGIHGRTNGYWNEDVGDAERLTCIQCHNPHSPKFPEQIPLPAPRESRGGSSTPTPTEDPHHG